MCLDVCIRSLNDLVVTMQYQEYRHRDTQDSANQQVAGLIAQLEEIKKTLTTIEGRHRLVTDPCPVCDIYKHHNHPKTEWRNVTDAHRDYDNNLLILGDDIDEKTLKEVFMELKNRFKISVTPIKLNSQNKAGIPLVEQQLRVLPEEDTQYNKAQRFVDQLPVWGMIINSDKKVLYTNAMASMKGVKVDGLCYQENAGNAEICGWCSWNRAELVTTKTCKFSTDSNGKQILSEDGNPRDIHWITLDKDLTIHFAALRDLSPYLKERLLESWKQLLDFPIPPHFLDAIQYPQ